MKDPQPFYSEDVYVVVPCFNEAPVIASVIKSLLRYFRWVIVVDDGSTDSSVEQIEKTKAICIKHPLNLGQGAAVFTGIEYVKKCPTARALVTFDADGQHSVEDAISYANEILRCEEGIIFGSRFMSDGSSVPRSKRFTLQVVTAATRLITGMELTDSHNGLKAFKIQALESLSTNLYRSAFETELVLNVSKNNISYKELPATVHYTDYSMKKGQRLTAGFLILEDLLRLLLKTWR